MLAVLIYVCPTLELEPPFHPKLPLPSSTTSHHQRRKNRTQLGPVCARVCLLTRDKRSFHPVLCVSSSNIWMPMAAAAHRDPVSTHVRSRAGLSTCGCVLLKIASSWRDAPSRTSHVPLNSSLP